MLGWILGGIAAAAVLCSDDGSSSNRDDNITEVNERLYRENQSLRSYNQTLQYENNRLKLTIHNQQSLLRNYDYVNRFSKARGYNGAVSFFYYLAENHDSDFTHYARFLNKVRCIRNDVAHNGTIYDIDNGFLEKLALCKKICDQYEALPYGRRLYLS